ncbi:MAG: MATE family efflux transporter [Desulfovibrio sp.]|nr:MATE family efflux transporter [Desulfovibrio sp.]
MIMMYLVFFMGFVSVWTAGRINADTQAALGMVTQCGLFLMVVIMAISSGATAAVSQSLGARRLSRAQRYVATTVIGSLGLGLALAVVGYIFDEQILRLLLVPEGIVPQALEMWRISLLALPAQHVYNATGVMFRATRQVKPPLYVAVLVCLVNMALCLGLGLGMFGMPNCGYYGILWANIAAQTIGAIVNCALLSRSGYLIRSTLPGMRWLKAGLPYLLRVALPAGFASLVWQSGYLALFVLVASLPHDSVAALAGLTAGLRVESLLFLPGMAFNMSVAVLVGNCLGAGRPREAKRLALNMTWAGTIALSVVAMMIWPFRQEIAAILAQDSATQTQIVSYLTYNLLSTPFSIASTVMGGIMVGAGATQYNLAVYGGCSWLIRLPVGWLLGHLLWQTASGVFCAMLISQCIQALLMLSVVNWCDWTRFAMRKYDSRTMQKQK